MANPFEEKVEVTSENPFIQPAEVSPTNPFLETPEKDSVTQPYSADDLVQDQYYTPIYSYMQDRFGLDDLRGKSREDVVDMYLNNMRGFSGGNSVRAVSEIAYVNSLDDSGLARAGEAYKVYEGMENIWGDTTGWEKAEAVGDFARTTILDPINLVSFGVGKLASAGTTKSAAKVAQKLAMRSYTRALGKGLTKDAAVKVGDATYAKVFSRVTKQEALSLAARRAAPSKAMKEVAAATVIDTAAGVASDYLYQDAMLKTDVQEEYSFLQTGIAGLGGLVMGGVQTGSLAFKNRNRLALASSDIAKPKTDNIGKKLKESVVKFVDPWKSKVAKGQKLEDVDGEVFIQMLLGNEELGIEGLKDILISEGFQWSKRNKDDKISNWLADIIKESDPQDIKSVVKILKDELGLDIPDNYTHIQFADAFAAKINQQARGLNAVSQAAKKLGKDTSEVTFGDILESEKLPLPSRVQEMETSHVMQLMSKNTEKFQNNIIRLIVSNLSTTALNIKGWGFATTMNTATDVGLALVHGGKGAAQLMLGSDAAGKESLRWAGQTLAAQRTKMLNLLDPNTTADAFRSYALVRPSVMREITDVLPGGVESMSKLAKERAFDPDQNVLMAGMDKYTEFASRASGVQAQDVITKSIEFMSQLDKKTRQVFNMSYSEFITHPNAAKMMADPKYLKLEAEAVYETQRAIFSKSYKGRTTIGEIATIIEDARKIPGIGLLVPFGRFFNNTVATMVDATGLALVGKLVGKQAERTYGDLSMRAFVGVGLIASLLPDEKEGKDAGIGLFERFGSNGEVVSEEYDFPASLYKAVARVISYKLDGEEVPPEIAQQITDTFFGQMTRQLDATSSSLQDLLKSILSGELDGVLEHGWETVKAPVPAVISGATRVFDPINQIVGLDRGEDFRTMDRRQGNELVNKSLRYMDQIIAVVTGIEGPEKFTGYTRKGTPDVGKFLGTRERVGYSNIEKLSNFIGRKPFKISEFSDAPEADNAYNKLFYLTVEEGAGDLINSDRFKNADYELRKHLATKLLKDSRQTALELMELDINNTGTVRLKTMLEVAKKPKEELKKALKLLEYNEDFSEMSDAQLEILLNFIETRKELLELK